MEISIFPHDVPTGPRFLAHVDAVLRAALRAFDDVLPRVEVRLRSRVGRYGERRFVCALDAVTVEGGRLRVEASSRYPHVAAERAGEQLVELLGYQLRSPRVRSAWTEVA